MQFCCILALQKYHVLTVQKMLEVEHKKQVLTFLRAELERSSWRRERNEELCFTQITHQFNAITEENIFN